MKSTKREKNTATLSMVRSITKSCRRRLGKNRTSFKILSRRKVRKTLRPELPPRSSKNAWQSSTTLKTTRCTSATMLSVHYIDLFAKDLSRKLLRLSCKIGILIVKLNDSANSAYITREKCFGIYVLHILS